MKLVTFGIDKDKNLIVQFPVFIHPYTQQLLILYQLETIPIRIIDQNTQTDSYTHLQIDRPYLALNSETYITIRQQELRMCKRIGYEFYCEELFIVKHKSNNNCKSTVYFDLDPDIIKENCKFTFYYNKTNISSTVLDGGNEIILPNWPNDKHIICNVNNDIPFRIPSHPYVLINRSVLCNCGIETGNNFLLESLAACHDSISELTMYFLVLMNKAFVNYLGQFDDLTDSLTSPPVVTDKITLQQTLPKSLNASKFKPTLLTAPQTLKDFVQQFCKKKEISDLKERHITMELELPNKNSFFNNFTTDVFLFITVIISILAITLVFYILCKHMILKTLVTSLALQQIKEVGVVTGQEDISPEIECTCKLQWYTILTSS